MTKAIAFFPWVKTREPITIGPIRLIPWVKGKTPNNLENAALHDIDNVLNAYANRPKNQIKAATLLEYGNWRTGSNAENYIDDLFFVRQLIGFSALSQRRLFDQGFNYCNFDNYSLIIQKYQENCGGNFAFTTRKRDGGCSHCWSSDAFAFHRPYHVDQQQIDIDQELIAALTKCSEIPDDFYSAIKEFNLANTDSSDIPEHIEMVMMKSAFEWLFQINTNADDFIKALKGLFSGFQCTTIPDTELTA